MTIVTFSENISKPPDSMEWSPIMDRVATAAFGKELFKGRNL